MISQATAQKRIRDAVNDYAGCKDAPPSNVTSGTCYEKLNKFQVIDAVVAMVLYLDLAAGSAGDLDLYKVNQAYLLDPVMREQINSLLEGWELPASGPHEAITLSST